MNTRLNKNHFKPIIFYFYQITVINKYKIINKWVKTWRRTKEKGANRRFKKRRLRKEERWRRRSNRRHCSTSTIWRICIPTDIDKRVINLSDVDKSVYNGVTQVSILLSPWNYILRGKNKSIKISYYLLEDIDFY